MSTHARPDRRRDVLGVHSLDHFALEVSDLAEAQHFFERFGLLARPADRGLGLHTHSHDHRWGTIIEGSRGKRLRHLSFGVFADDFERFDAHLAAAGTRRIGPPDESEANGIWFEGFDGLPLNLRIAEKSSPEAKSSFSFHSTGPGESGAIPNSKAPRVLPRRLSHVMLFTTNVSKAIEFYTRLLGLRLSDRSGDVVAFLHGPHGSDHHMLAVCSSDHSGMHHASWDVGSVQEVGLGAAQMAKAGYKRGWGLGRHVLGANYFHYVRDPWGSYCEYSADIDFIPAEFDWEPGDHAPEDALYLWGPTPPADFVQNSEPAS